MFPRSKRRPDHRIHHSTRQRRVQRTVTASCHFWAAPHTPGAENGLALQAGLAIHGSCGFVWMKLAHKCKQLQSKCARGCLLLVASQLSTKCFYTLVRFCRSWGARLEHWRRSCVHLLHRQSLNRRNTGRSSGLLWFCVVLASFKMWYTLATSTG